MPSSRRQWMQQAGAALLLRGQASSAQPSWRVAGRDVELQVSTVSARTVRITVAPIQEGQALPVAEDGSLAETARGISKARLRHGPVKQYTSERVDEPTTLSIYPGADGAFSLYEDDGRSFDYRRGEWMGLEMGWNNARRALTLRLANGSRMLAARRVLAVTLGDVMREAVFEGRPMEVRF